MRIQEQYNSYKEGKLSGDQFAYNLRRSNFANKFTPYNTLQEMISILKSHKLIFDNAPVSKANLLILEEKKTSKPTLDPNSVNQHEYRLGLVQEMSYDCDPQKIHDKIINNLLKDPNYYTNQIQKGKAFLQESDNDDLYLENILDKLLEEDFNESPESFVGKSLLGGKIEKVVKDGGTYVIVFSVDNKKEYLDCFSGETIEKILGNGKTYYNKSVSKDKFIPVSKNDAVTLSDFMHSINSNSKITPESFNIK